MGDTSNVCPICHKESLYIYLSCGEWVVGCDVCDIETEPKESQFEAEQEWERMMKDRLSFVINV